MSVQVEVENSHSFSEKAPEEVKKQNKPFKVMPFGKYRLLPFDDIVKITEIKNGKLIYRGKEYLEWVFKQEFVKQDLKDAIKPYILV